MDKLIWVGRKSKPLYKKLNPIWWFGNDFEPTAPAWYIAQGGTTLKWYLRNSLQNCESFCAFYAFAMVAGAIAGAAYYFGFSYYYAAFAAFFIGGVQDKDYTVYGSAPITNTNMVDAGLTGWMWKVTLLHGFIPLPYVSYGGSRIIAHIGWNQMGKFVKKLTLLNSKIQAL